ncbi:MAG: DUF192 domain-containing protein [Bacillota bacterium]
MKSERNITEKFLVVLIILALAAIIAGCAAESDTNLSVEEVYLADRLFELELALTPDQRAQGLMGREFMADDEGMLFVFPDEPPYPAEVSFWMKDCLMPIDVIFIDREGIVSAIHEMQPPKPGTPDENLTAYSSNGPVQFAIELRGGLTYELGLEVGNFIELRREYLMSLAQ